MTKNNETIDLKEYTDQYSAWLEPIDSFIKYAADGVSKNHFFDFGCGIGPWVMMSTKTFNESNGSQNATLARFCPFIGRPFFENRHDVDFQ